MGMPHNGQYQGHHPGTHSFPPSHPTLPKDQEPIDKIPKRAVVTQSKEPTPGQLSPGHGGMYIDLHLTHWGPGNISPIWEFSVQFQCLV